MNTPSKPGDWDHPTLAQLLEAAPDLHWRKCRQCGHVAMHVDSVGQWVTCRIPSCNSMDTRLLRDETKMLLDMSRRCAAPAHRWRSSEEGGAP